MGGEPNHGFGGGRYTGPGRNEWAGNHDNGQPECARSFDLRYGRVSARVLRQDRLDAMLAEEADIVIGGERAARLDDFDVRQIGRLGGAVDQADNVAVLWRGLQVSQGKTADGAEDRAGFGAERCDGGRHVLDLNPNISSLFYPGGPLQREQRRICQARRFDGVAAHLRGKGMRGVDQKIDAFGLEIVGEPFGATKAAAAGFNGLRPGRKRPASKRQDGFEPEVCRNKFRERARFGRAAEKEHAHGPCV